MIKNFFPSKIVSIVR